MKFHSFALVIAAAAAMTACSNSSVMFANQRTTAPANAKDMGMVIDGAQASDVQDLVKDYPQAQVRVVSEPHGIYEVFGIPVAQVQAKFPANSAPNQFRTLHVRKPGGSFAMESVAAPAGMQVGNLKPCVTTTNGPNAVLSASSPSANLNGSVIQLGQTVKIDGLKSKSQLKGGVLNAFIGVKLPETAATPELDQNGNTYQFTPDTMGLYQVALIVQDAGGACAGDMIQFIVTAQRQYTPNAAAQQKPLDITKFNHLTKIHAPDAWKISQGKGMIIAVVDTGVDYNHPYLASQILVNTKEIPNNGIDDDKNGYVDDYVGYNFAYQTAFPYDDDSHGTHVSGLAAGAQFGLAQQAKILPVKSMTPAGGDDATIAAGIRYAVDRGANIINLSIGSQTPEGNPSQVLSSAMQYAQSKGVLLVAAAGNGDANGNGFDIDTNHVFPASMPLDDVVAVAAFSATEDLTTYSNFGGQEVAVCADGGDENDFLISAAYENPQNAMFIGMVGTSMATPVTAGIAADVWSTHPQMTYKQVIAILESSGPDVAALKGKVISGKHLDALAAVQAAVAQVPQSLVSK